jgi:hypothetical protein
VGKVLIVISCLVCVFFDMCVELLSGGGFCVFVMAIWGVVIAFGGVKSLSILYALHQLLPNMGYVSPSTANTMMENLFVFVGQQIKSFRVDLYLESGCWSTSHAFL